MRATIAMCAVLLAACDLVPPPRLAARRDAGVDAIPPAPALAATTDAGDDADLDDGPEPSPECIATAGAIANVVIAGGGSNAHGSYEQGRGAMIRKIARACTVQNWNADKQRCFHTATLEVDIRACEAKFPNPEPAGSGS